MAERRSTAEETLRDPRSAIVPVTELAEWVSCLPNDWEVEVHGEQIGDPRNPGGSFTLTARPRRP